MTAAYYLSKRLGETLLHQGLVLATAESCTGGAIAAAITAVAGSSAWFERGFVAYSNAAKQEMLNVLPETLATQGAVSEPVALEMALGAIENSTAQCSLAVTGIAGPTGGTPAKPVGTVCFAWAREGFPPRSSTVRYLGDRQAIRQQAILTGMQGTLELFSSSE